MACTFDVSAGGHSVSCLLTQGRAALAHGTSHHFSYPGLRVPGDLRCSLRMVVFHSCTYLSPDKSPFFFFFVKKSSHSSRSQNRSHGRNSQDHHLSEFCLLDHRFTSFAPYCGFPIRNTRLYFNLHFYVIAPTLCASVSLCLPFHHHFVKMDLGLKPLLLKP